MKTSIFARKSASANPSTRLQMAETGSLKIGYEETGHEEGEPVLLLHGWPYSPRTYDQMIDPLVALGYRVIVPYARCFGPTVYQSKDIFRSGEQAALGRDLIDLMDALHIVEAVLVGYDWGSRAGCVAAALWPERVRALVTMPGYAIVNREKEAGDPGDGEHLHNTWYRWFMNSPQGQEGLARERKSVARECWKSWSPTWAFPEDLFKASAKSLENDDWLATTLQSYRHWYTNALGDPALRKLEARLAKTPKIDVPTVALTGDASPLHPLKESLGKDKLFSGRFKRRVLKNVGHCPPAEAPNEVIRAVTEAIKLASE